MFKRVLLLASVLFFACFSTRAASLTAGIGSYPTTNNCTYQTFNFTDASTYTGNNKGFNRVKWFFSDGSTDTGVSVFKTFTSTATFTIKLVVSNAKDNIQDSVSKTINITLAGIKPGFLLLGRGCQRVELKVINKSVPLPKTGVSWLWDFGDGSKNTSTDSFIHVYPNSGTFPVTLKVTAANGCVSTTSQTEVIKVTPQAKATKTQHCQDSAATFDASSTVTNGLNVAYTWTFRDKTVLNGAKVSKVFTVDSSYQVILAVINNTNGCNDTLPVSFIAYSKPKPAFTYIPVCQDSIAIFSDATTIKYGPTAIASWHWTFSDSLHKNYGTPFDATSDTIVVKHGFPHGGTFNVNLTVKTKVGCVDSATQQVYINPTPTPDFAFKNTCQDSAMKFSDSSKVPKGNKITGWLWNFGDSNSQHKPYTSTLQNPSHQYAKPGYGYKVKLIVSTQAGCKDSITKKVIAYPSPKSAFAFGPKCAKDNVNFLNNSSMPLSAVNDSIRNYLWLFGDGLKDSVLNPSHPYQKSGNFNVKLISYSRYGCTDTAKAIVLVYPLPIPKFKLQGNCERDSVQFINTSTTAYGTLIDSSYTWDYGDLTTSNVIINPHHLYKTAGTFNVKLTVVAKGAGCTKDSTIAITIIPGPHSDFSWVASCFKQPIKFTNLTTSNTKGTIKYFWDFGDGTTDTTKNPTHTYTSVKNYNVKLVSTMPATGCNDSIVHFVSVAPLPKAYYHADNVCNNKAVTFTDSSTLATNYYFKSFDFDFGDGKTGKGPKTTHKYANPGNYLVKEIVTGTTGCQDSFYRTVSTYLIPKPMFSSGISCAGTPTQFTDATDPADSANLWRWTFGGSTIFFVQPQDAVHNPSHVFKNADQPITELKVTTIHGCSDSISKPINILLEPEPTFIPPTGCSARDLSFFGSQKNKGSVFVTSYSWNFADGKTATSQQAKHRYDTSGTFKVALTEVSDKGCSNTDTETVNVIQLPKPYFFYQGNCFGEQYSFIDSSSFTANTQYQYLRFWDFGDGSPQTNDKDTKHKYPAAGTYTVKLYITVTDPNANLLCTSDIDSNSKVLVHPVPLAKFGWDTACFGNPTAFHDSSDAFGSRIQKYLWTLKKGFVNVTDSVKNPFYTFADTFQGLQDTFRVYLKVTTNFGCTNKTDRLVYVKQRPKASFVINPNPITIQHPKVSFTNTTLYADTAAYYWNFGDGFDSHKQNPTHSYNDTGTYTVTLSAVSKRGCVDTSRYTLYVTPGYSIFAPNAMTVNGDGHNDEWGCKGVGVIDFDVVIVDIWGQIVYHSTDLSKNWKGDYNGNGIKVPEGMYIYYVKAGNFANTDFTTLKGNITLIR